MTEDQDGDVFTIAIFCRRNRIAQSTYFALARQGLGPRLMKFGKSAVRITRQAEADWHHEREIAANTEQKVA